VTLTSDLGGVEAERFQTKTSGQAILYDSAGHLRFNGGITASRGHEGDNVGLDAIADEIMRPGTGAAHAPVFGCRFGRELGKS
jgi:hypothetical protein